MVEYALRGHLAAILANPQTPTFKSAACDGVDTELFYSDDAAGIVAAKNYCAQCPIAQACATWGINHVNFGILGGLTAEERFVIRGGVDAIEIDEIRELHAEFKFVMESSASEVALHYGAESRTVVRWRNILRPYALAA